MASDVAEQTFQTLVEHIRQHHVRLEQMADAVLIVIHDHGASVRDVVALIGLLLARIEHQDFAVRDVLEALLLAHDKRAERRAGEGN